MEDTIKLVTLAGITCSVSGRKIIDNFSIELRAGELIEIWGPNGSGKSTLLRCMAGLFEQDVGNVEIRRDSTVVYLGHKSGISNVLSPEENLSWFAGLVNLSPQTINVSQALEMVGMNAYSNRLCGELSAGQLRRVALARLLISDARVWILDEPLTSLDQEGVRLLSTLIGRHRKNGGLVVCATHQSLADKNTRVVHLE